MSLKVEKVTAGVLEMSLQKYVWTVSTSVAAEEHLAPLVGIRN
tara:strand:+ start:7157 stop:7285 length:129 start_codon:yes stop_codon:yes gene_type:complete